MKFPFPKKEPAAVNVDPRKLRDIIADQAEAKGISVSDLAKRSGAPSQYIDALTSGNTKYLPAFPYIRPHLIKIADALGLPPQTLIEKYRAEFAAMHSGAADRLPGNRFALPTYRRPYLIGIGVLVVILLIYVVTRSGFLGQANLVITNPPEAPSPFITTSAALQITGRTDPGDTLMINGQHVAVASDGTFSKEYQLLPEINIISFSAKRFLGRSVTLTRQVYFDQQPDATSTAPTAVPEPQPEPEPTESLETTTTEPTL